MRSRRVAASVARLAVCVVAVVAITAVLHGLPIRDRALVAALAFLFVVVVASAFWGLRYAIVISLLAGPAFTYLVPPVGRSASRNGATGLPWRHSHHRLTPAISPTVHGQRLERQIG